MPLKSRRITSSSRQNPTGTRIAEFLPSSEDRSAEQTRVQALKPLLFVGVLALIQGAGEARPPGTSCPGEATLVMRHCAADLRKQSESR